METTVAIYNIYFNRDLNAIVMEWNGYANSAEFREGTELMLNSLIKHNCTKVFADLREMVLIAQDDQRWLEHNFLPRAIKFGFKQIAIIKPKAYFNRVAVESVSYKIDKAKLSISFFDNPEDAANWLKAEELAPPIRN